MNLSVDAQADLGEGAVFEIETGLRNLAVDDVRLVTIGAGQRVEPGFEGIGAFAAHGLDAAVVVNQVDGDVGAVAHDLGAHGANARRIAMAGIAIEQAAQLELVDLADLVGPALESGEDVVQVGVA